MPATVTADLSLPRLHALLSTLDPHDMGPCGVPGCVHLGEPEYVPLEPMGEAA